MKNLVFLLLIILTIGTFSLNATSGKKTPNEQIMQPVVKLSDFKKDVSSAD